MRIAVLADIHGNRTAFQAVLADLRDVAPDAILHGGDLTDNGSSPVEICDAIRSFGWRGVVGNTDEMLFHPAALEEVAAQAPQLNRMFEIIAKMAAFTRAALGEERIEWLSHLPKVETFGEIALVHATKESCWRGPSPEATDANLMSVFAGLEKPIVVYGHVHRGFIRRLKGLTVANSGSVGMPYDGDPRASYLLVTDGDPELRRVEYDLGKEIALLAASGLPHSDWVAKTLRAAAPTMP